MDTTTFFSKFVSFSKKWAKYKKQIVPIPLAWIIMSDYCLDDKNKNDCVTFTISPMMPGEEVSGMLGRKLPRDIKDITKVTEEEIAFIRDAYPFFTISVVFKEKKIFGDINNLKEDIKRLRESPYFSPIQRKRLNKFDNYLKQKNINHKVLRNMLIIAGIFARIVEFLTIKHNAQEIHWFPDRDAVMDVSDKIILDLISIQCASLLRGRRPLPKFCVGVEDKKNGVYIFDAMIRYPDIITGVISSIDLDKGFIQKEKHCDLLAKAILKNPRIIIMEIGTDLVKVLNFKVIE